MIRITVKRRSPLILTAQKLNDIGSIVMNKELIIVCANSEAHRIMRYPQESLYGKSLSVVIDKENSDREVHDEELLRLLSLEDKVIARQMPGSAGQFMSIIAGDGNPVRIATFYITDPINQALGCYFIEYEKGDDVDDVVAMTLKLQDLKNSLFLKVKERNISYKLNETYKDLFRNWKHIALGVGSVMLFTTGVFGLFVSGFIGNRFGRKPSEVYEQLEQKMNEAIERRVHYELEETN